jgi:hypothetical protein
MTLEELEKRVKVLEDIEAIKQLHVNYVYLLCNLQWDDMVECFAEGATRCQQFYLFNERRLRLGLHPRGDF